jgi:hypothetical protein
MSFIRERRNQLLLALPLAVVVTAATVTACGSGGSSGLAQGAAPGQWTKAQVSQFAAAGGTAGSDTEDTCITGDFARDMSFGNAMAVVSVDPPSANMSAAQIKAALETKYGTTEGDAIDTQFEQVAADASSNCSGSAAASSAPAAPVAAPPSTAAPALTPAPGATSESSCTVDCVNPVASGETGWLAQVQGALQDVQQDLSSISSDTSSDPASLTLDGANLTQDAQAALDPNYDPPPADNTDWVNAMNAYVMAGEDYTGDNTNEEDNTAATANAELRSGDAALDSFNAANGGVLNGTIQPL